MAGEDFRSGFVTFVGRPNAGKSTLMNALVGHKVAITSDRPQTTRRTIRGIKHHPRAQVIIVDTPGVHRPKTLLGQRLNDEARAAAADVDVVGVCIPADQPVGRGDSFVIQQLATAASFRIAIVTKTDTVGKERVVQQLARVHSTAQELAVEFDHFIAVSAVTGEGLDTLTDLIVEGLPVGSPLYGEELLRDEPVEVSVSELIREAALTEVSDELPHSIAVVVEEIAARPDAAAKRGLLDVRANIFVERDSQKAIIIGKGGSRLKEVGTRARCEIEALLDAPVHLDLRVKVAKDWQKDPKQMRRLGF